MDQDMLRADAPVRCDIVMPAYDQLEYTRGCVQSIFAHTAIPFRLIVINNGSKGRETGAYLDALQAREPRRVLVLTFDQNQGYLKAANHGLAHTSAEFVVLMNNDTVAYPGWLTEMIKVAEQDPLIGIVNPQWDPPKTFRGSREQFFQKCVLPYQGTYIETDWARGFCHLIKRGVIDKIGGLDAVFDPGYYDDWDYSMRAMAAGYRCVKALGAFVFHYKNVTYSVCGEKDQINALINTRAPLFYERWGRSLKLLIIDDGSAGDIKARVLQFLRDQNRVILVTTRSMDLAHTNLLMVRVPGWCLWPAVFYMFGDDLRHSAVKRFHLVLAGAGGIFFLKGLGVFSKCYPIELLSAHRDLVLEGLLTRMKFGAHGQQGPKVLRATQAGTKEGGEHRVCRICGNSQGNASYTVREMMFGLREKFVYVECGRCRCLQIADLPLEMAAYYPKNYYSFSLPLTKIKLDRNRVAGILRSDKNNRLLSIKGFIGKIISSFYPEKHLYAALEAYCPQRRGILALNLETRILDVGCGQGAFLYFLKECGFENVLGIDPYIEKDIVHPNGLRVMKKAIHALEGRSFDLITFHHSFEHLPDPLETLRSVERLLSAGGVCLLRIPTVDSYAWRHYRENWVSLDAPRHFFLHSIESIRALAHKAGLKLVRVAFDSTAFQFTGSEQYMRDIPLMPEAREPKHRVKRLFSRMATRRFKGMAGQLNLEGQGDQAAFYLQRPSGADSFDPTRKE